MARRNARKRLIIRLSQRLGIQVPVSIQVGYVIPGFRVGTERSDCMTPAVEGRETSCSSATAESLLFRLQHADEKDELPALRLGKLAKRWHAAIGVSVRNLPKQRPIALVLNDRKL
jgi:hypothetical protein